MQEAYENARTWLTMLDTTMTHGTVVKPRGYEIVEIEDFQITVSPKAPFMEFTARNYNVDYFKKEMLWKLTANKFDESIKAHAKMWESVQNPDGTFNSNYGQYWFGEQQGFFSVVSELMRDKDSRRAVIPMLSKEHMTPETIDTVCTESVGFRIRNGKLNMSVHMRSSDQIFGLGTDIPTFSFLYRLVYGALQGMYPELEIGVMRIVAMSSHIYSRHFEMVSTIISQGDDEFKFVDMPWPKTVSEALYIAASRGKGLERAGELGNWLIGE